MYEHASALARAGDVAGARALHEAIGRLLADAATDRGDVVDIASRRKGGAQ